MRTPQAIPVPARLGRLLLLSLAAAAVILGACGADGTRAELRVEGDEMSFSAPSEAPAGQYAVTFINVGKVAHELAIKDPSGKVVVRRSIAAGAEAILEVSLTPGSWELACHELGHYEAGMVRKLDVVAAKT